MLYVSTRNRTEVYTAHRALHENAAPDGGMFVPFQLPKYEQNEIAQLENQSFGETVAQILNLFFASQLNGWDVDFCIGRMPIKLRTISRRTILAELWHNPASTYAYVEQNLYAKMAGVTVKPTNWACVAIRIAVLFGLYGVLLRSGTEKIDIAITAGDFTVPMSAWYARKMGLPIETVVCSCSENGSVWDFIQRGELNTGVTANRADCQAVVPIGLERLIFETLGSEAVANYISVRERGGVYRIPAEESGLMNHRLYVSVVGARRIDSVISSVFRTRGCVLDPHTAMSYASLQDYRAQKGENITTVFLADNSPLAYAGHVASAIGIPERDLPERLHAAKE